MRNVPYSLADVVWLLSFPILMSIGQLVLRFVAERIAEKPIQLAFAVLLTLPAFYGAVFMYGLSMLLWVWLLGRYPLSLAYPFAAMAIVFVPMLDMLVFRHPLAISYWVGVLIIISGIVLIFISQRSM